MCIWEWQKRAFDYAWHKNMKLWWAAKPHIIVASTPPRLYCTLLFDFPFTYDSNTNCRLLSVWFFSSTFLCFGIIVVVASYEDLPIAFSFPLNSWSIASFDQTHVLFLICGDIKILTKLLNLCHLLFLIPFTFFSLSSNDVPSKTMHNYSQPLDENNRSNWRSNTKQNQQKKKTNIFTRTICGKLWGNATGFTMYTTCVIWLAFVPLYFGTGNHVPLRLTSMSVTISLSASVTVACLFSPKVSYSIYIPHTINYYSSKSTRCWLCVWRSNLNELPPFAIDFDFAGLLKCSLAPSSRRPMPSIAAGATFNRSDNQQQKPRYHTISIGARSRSFWSFSLMQKVNKRQIDFRCSFFFVK